MTKSRRQDNELDEMKMALSEELCEYTQLRGSYERLVVLINRHTKLLEHAQTEQEHRQEQRELDMLNRELRKAETLNALNRCDQLGQHIDQLRKEIGDRERLLNPNEEPDMSSPTFITLRRTRSA